MAFLSRSTRGDFSSSVFTAKWRISEEIERMEARIVSGVENYTLDDATQQ